MYKPYKIYIVIGYDEDNMFYIRKAFKHQCEARRFIKHDDIDGIVTWTIEEAIYYE